MKPIALFILGIGLVMPLSQATADQPVSVQSMPPVVVGTFPEAGEVNVDASTSEIRVTFSKDMMTNDMWSWVIHTKETFPEIVGKVRYLPDQRTCVAPVRLEPGQTYAIWFNAPDYTYNAFRDQSNKPAVPYLLVFSTGD